MNWSVVVGEKVYDVKFKKIKHGICDSDYIAYLHRHSDEPIKLARVIKGMSGGWDVLAEVEQSKWVEGFHTREHATQYALKILNYYK